VETTVNGADFSSLPLRFTTTPTLKSGNGRVYTLPLLILSLVQYFQIQYTISPKYSIPLL